MKTLEIAEQHLDYMVDLRRTLHRHPELSFKEDATSKLVQAELQKLGIPFVVVGDHGVVATIEGTRTDQIVALRADMDALPIQEDNAHLDYQSAVAGVMHACGHDGHVAMLLGAARVLLAARDSLHGTVKLCFQQAEERGGGTKEILEELAKHPVKSVFGIHLWSEIESGRISVEAGPRMAAGDRFEIVVRGVGCHGANPDRGIDPVIAAAAIILNASALISREVNPVHATVLTFGKIQGGVAANVIPEQVALSGTMRNTNRETRAHLKEALVRMVTSTAEAYRAKAEIVFSGTGLVVYNEARCSEIAASAARDSAGEAALIQHPCLMASENYGEFLEAYPGVFAFVGARNPDCGACYPHHHPKFNIDEKAMARGAALHAQYAINFFNS
ncbi:amidohydrolase [Polaromonas sp. OV174]|uniref:amidohydrolase n=1 Tax=Polaromonas sp. OV174 TaxID=1855300 RepID=UPI0008F44657|nr:amidohydrolase [Polaromonas sp. OV174]SFC72468.1 amidohydrolase [Polaromonas sp. OV174]